VTAQRDPDRLIRAFLAEGQTELPDRAYDAVRESIDHTRQRVVIGPWTAPRMNSFARIAIAAAAIVVVAVLGINLLPRSGGFGGGPSPSPSLSPSPTPTPVVLPDNGDLEPGTYFVDRRNITPARFTLTMPAGWETIDYAIIGKTDGGAKGPTAFRAALSTWLVANVWADPCKSVTGGKALPVGSATTVDSLATALSEQVGRNGSTPTDVTIGGLSGKKVELSVPADFDSSTCEGGNFRVWQEAGAQGGDGGFVYGPGQRNTVYILDANGTPLVIDAMYLPNATVADKAELQAIIDSVRFEP
jgi:hypothetical protein